jgi:hypothetical protein
VRREIEVVARVAVPVAVSPLKVAVPAKAGEVERTRLPVPVEPFTSEIDAMRLARVMVDVRFFDPSVATRREAVRPETFTVPVAVRDPKVAAPPVRVPKLPVVAKRLVEVLFVKTPVLGVLAPMVIPLIVPPVRVAFDDEKVLAVTPPLKTLAPETKSEATVVDESVVVARVEVPEIARVPVAVRLPAMYASPLTPSLAAGVVEPMPRLPVEVSRTFSSPPTVKPIVLAAGRYIPVVASPVHEKLGVVIVSAPCPRNCTEASTEPMTVRAWAPVVVPIPTFP